MKKDKVTILPHIGYTQSANTLFHFMKKIEYLETILRNRAIVPRYCVEDIEYLDIFSGTEKYNRIAILQKCFCDIPFHKLTDSFETKVLEEDCRILSNDEKRELDYSNTHPDYYGKFAIAFSKEWGEENNLQPVHYLNQNSSYTKHLQKLFNDAINSDNIEDLYADDVLQRLAFIKPLRGKMMRMLSNGRKVTIYKNFCDEQEWRYVPFQTELAEAEDLNKVIAGESLIRILVESDFSGTNINDKLYNEKYRGLWLKFNYNDIRYIIVPDLYRRIDIIKCIASIPDEQFKENERELLISKILVLNEIGGDW